MYQPYSIFMPVADMAGVSAKNFIYKNEMLNDLSAWLRSFKAPRKDAVRVACVGNSITYGARIKNQSHDSYPAVLGRLLGDKYWVKNFGVSARTMLNKGDHPYMKEQAYQQALAFNPNIVVIKLGTNDSKSFNWVYKADFIKIHRPWLTPLKPFPHNLKSIYAILQRHILPEKALMMISSQKRLYL